MKLEILICTIDDGINRVAEMLMPRREDVGYLVSWQLCDARDAPLPLERNEQGTWNTTGHPDRVVQITDETLGMFVRLYDDPGTPPRQARLAALYTRGFLTPVLEKF